jgi:Dehydrogenases (flavoproteins)
MDIDTVIVGSGPAGLAAAFFLKGRTAVIERLDSNYDRYHSICGEGISEDAFAALRPMEPWAAKNRVSVTKLKWPGGKVLEIGSKGYILDRPKFLKELKSRCDAEFINGNVVDIIQNNDSYEVILNDGRSLKCKYLIGADGCYSVVRRKIFGTEPLRMISVKHMITETEHDGSMTIELGERYDGTYRWTFPSGDNVSVGCMTSIDPDLKGATRTISVGCVDEVVKGNAFLAGDAAGMANPVSFGGLRAAMGSKSIRKMVVVICTVIEEVPEIP